MPSDLETLIREVLTEQADGAPHRATVLAGLRWARGRRPHRRLAMVAAGVAVGLAVIGVPIGLQLTTQPLTAGTQQVLHVQQPDIPLPYHVTWLPPGYVTSMRVATPTDLGQTWEPAGHDRAATDLHGSVPFIQLDIFSDAAGDLARTLGDTSDGVPVDVNGAQAYMSENVSAGDNGVMLTGITATWVPRQGVTLELSVFNAPNETGMALQVARSVVPGGTDVIAQPLSLGDLPSRYTDELEIHGTSASQWTVSRVATSTDHNDPAITAVWSTAEPRLDSRTAITVRGQQGWYGTPTAEPDAKAEIVALDGHWLMVSMSAGTDMATLTRIANGVAVFPAVGFPWLGR